VSAVFVFGSNLAGRHGKGAALAARTLHGAQLGVGEGRTGNAYAIPIKTRDLRARTLDEIRASVDTFKEYAGAHPETLFEVTRVGCGLAGYRDYQIGPMFAGSPANCVLPDEWLRFR
jgi:hypothetical protein